MLTSEKTVSRVFARLPLAAVCVLWFAAAVGAQPSSGALRGQVKDEFGGVIVGAVVTAADAAGVEKAATTDEEGRYGFSALAPGSYAVRVAAPGFAAYENLGVEVAAGSDRPLDITLAVAIEVEEVTVTAEAEVSTDAESNAGAVVLRGTDLDALPDDPEDLAEALQALAGPSVGASGEGEFFIDGFSGGRLPPKESIREIRINRNPFSAEYDRLGYGRTEIFTKPGTDRFRGEAHFNFNDEALNSRSPFAPTRAAYQARRYGGNLSGPLSAKRASFFIDFQRRETDDNEIVNAVVLDPQFNPVPFRQTILTPDRRTEISPRLDYQINPSNTLVARYSFERSTREDEGVGDFNLPERAYDVENTEHTLQLTETAIINQKIINETRFQYRANRRRQEGDAARPTLRVLDAFTGGGAQVGLSTNDADRFELQNYSSWTVGNHSLKAGARLRHVSIRDVSPQNFSGTFTFGGGLAPQLDGAGNIVRDAAGQPVLVNISSIERFRRTQVFLRDGLAPAEIRARGGGATQFSINGGDPEASVSRTDFSPFIQDDWRLRPNLTLSLGLRYENQTNIDSNLNFAPRAAFAWSPGAGADARRQTTVIRGGLGIFYERFGENLTLQAVRQDGISRQQFLVTANTPGGTGVLDLFPNVPTLDALGGFAVAQSVRRVADDLQAPYTMQAALSVERQLPYRFTVSINFIAARTLHVLRSRNTNAPFLLPTGERVRPTPGLGNLFLYESSGRFAQRQLIVNVNNRYSRKFTLFANYVWNRARSDTDGAGSFPANQYDLTGEYGRSAQDIRHRLFLGGAINALPWGIRLNPFITINSGRPFNITTGQDLNGDTLFNDRPSLVSGETCAARTVVSTSVVCTPYGTFNLRPGAGDTPIPRNFAEGPGFFAVNLRASKTIGFGGETAAAGADAAGQGGRRGGGGGGRRGGGGGRGGGGRGGGGTFGGGGEGGETASRYNMTFSVNVQNLFNRTNLGTPVGNLSSPLFGQSTGGSGRFGFGGGAQTAGNRRVELQLRLSF